MATLDGKEVPQCERCTLYKAEVREYTVDKGDQGQVRRSLCEDCRVNTEVTYGVTKAGRKSADADAPKDEDPKEPVSTESTKERRLDGEPPQRRSK